MVNLIILCSCILVFLTFERNIYIQADTNATTTVKSSFQIIHSTNVRLGKKNGMQSNDEKHLNLSNIQVLIDRAHNSTRDRHVLLTLQSAAGVYTDKERGITAGLQKTVFMTIVSYNTKAGLHHYKIYFRNFLCFAQHFGIDLIVYILHHSLPNVEEEVQSLQKLGVRVLTYPDERFWKLVHQKKSKIMPGGKFADYDSEEPNFSSFGALVMLVPQLEALELGFNVIYFDVDIGLVQDPVPFLTRGDADFTSSIESRECTEDYPSSRKMNEAWDQIEPNTGVMHVRATSQGVNFYKNWLRRIIKTNVRNDQNVFDRDSRPLQVELVDGQNVYSENNFTSTFTPSCNWDYRNATRTVRATPKAATYCFLSEMMFQNGMTSFTCSLGKKTRDDWYLEMVKQVSEVEVNGNKVRLPVTVHANYCNGKSKELDLRGLWLYDEKLGTNSSSDLTKKYSESQCKSYNVSNVYFARLNFTAEVALIENDRLSILKSVLINGTLIKRFSASEVYLISMELSRRLIPDGDTFLGMGYEFGAVRAVPTTVLNLIPEGPPFISTSKKQLKKIIAKRKSPI